MTVLRTFTREGDVVVADRVAAVLAVAAEERVVAQRDAAAEVVEEPAAVAGRVVVGERDVGGAHRPFDGEAAAVAAPGLVPAQRDAVERDAPHVAVGLRPRDEDAGAAVLAD